VRGDLLISTGEKKGQEGKDEQTLKKASRISAVLESNFL